MAHRFYVANAEAGYDGPFEAEVIQARLRAGQIQPSTQVFREHGQQWQPLSTVPELMPAGPLRQPAPIRPGARPPTQPLLGSVRPNALDQSMHLGQTDYVGPVLVTLFCCLISGIGSVVYTWKANEAAKTGDLQRYESARRSRMRWMMASIVIALIVVGIQVMLVVMGIIGQVPEYAP